MTMPTIADYLKYANLQMAAEAFLVTDAGALKTGKDLIDALIEGNKHALVFTATQATDFLVHWKVLAQQPNTKTGDDWDVISGDMTGTPFSQEQYITVETNNAEHWEMAA